MELDFKYGPVGDDVEWAALGPLLGVPRPQVTLAATLSAFREAGALAFILEQPYLDRDFSASFSAFYSSSFRPHNKLCRRVHFFSDANLAIDLGAAGLDELPALIEARSASYLGFIVIRPLEYAPLGFAVLSATVVANRQNLVIGVRSEFQTHVLGASLMVKGVPITQQDTRVGSCAQAALWVVGRHLHQRHGAPWFSVPEITALALNPVDARLAQSLPAGSSFLHLDNMVRALRSMGRSPFVYIKMTNGKWTAPPQQIIDHHLESGVPVIVGLHSQTQSIGHAVVAIGTERFAPDLASLPQKPTVAEGVSSFIVVDDQRGPYCKLPVLEANRSATFPWTLETDCQYLLVPLPDKVLVSGSYAELRARDLLDNAVRQRASIRASKGVPDVQVDADFNSAALSDKAVSRAYLTYGWKYKARALRNSVSPEFSRELQRTGFLKYVWVVEFATPDHAFLADPCVPRVHAHAVFDATGSERWASNLLFASPGVSTFWRYVKANDPAVQTVLLETDEMVLLPKKRGWLDFTQCAP